MGWRELRDSKLFALFILGITCGGCGICAGLISLTTGHLQTLREERQHRERWRQAKIEYEEIDTIEEGPVRKAELESWKEKYPDLHAKFLRNSTHAGEIDPNPDQGPRAKPDERTRKSNFPKSRDR